MKQWLAAAAAGLALLAGTSAEAAKAAHPARAAHAARAAEPSCDRACLQGFIDLYIRALAAHDPGMLPLAKGARFTENGQTLDLGDGLWGTFEAKEGYTLMFSDPQAGQVGAYVTIRESGRHQILGLRLRIVAGAIAEMETLVLRPHAGFVFGEPGALKDQEIFHEALAPEQKRPRAELVNIANSYFEGLVNATETLTPFDDDCQRIENGIVTANNPRVPPGGFPVWKLGCQAQFATHFSQFITSISDRRFPVVDEERGLVLAVVSMNHAGKMKTQVLADGTVSPVPENMQVPLHLRDLRAVQDPRRQDRLDRGAGLAGALQDAFGMGEAMIKRIAAALAALSLSAAASAAPAPARPAVVPPVCDRACLEGMIDTYLGALAAKDPRRLPLSGDARFTENGVELKLGDGLWGNVEGLGDYRLTFVDPETQQAGVFATVKESGRQVLLGVRLQIQSARRISQIETIVARGGLRGVAQPALTRKPVFYEDVPAPERRSRGRMLAITDSYFEGLAEATGAITPFDPDCQRIENGNVTSNNPSAEGIAKLSCGAQFDTGFSPFITSIRDRRYPIMDVEKGLGFGMVFFDHNGTIKDIKETDGTVFHPPPPFDAPYSFQIFELFKIRDGKIIRVEAILNTVPYGMRSGW